MKSTFNPFDSIWNEKNVVRALILIFKSLDKRNGESKINDFIKLLMGKLVTRMHLKNDSWSGDILCDDTFKNVGRMFCEIVDKEDYF